MSVKARNPNWLKVDHALAVMDVLNRGMTLLCVAIDFELPALFCLKSTIRTEAATVV